MATAAAAVNDPDPLKETGRYEKIQSLGKGAFGFVQLGRNLQTKELAAVKFLKRGDVNKYVESEIVNHRWVSSGSITHGDSSVPRRSGSCDGNVSGRLCYGIAACSDILT